MAELSDSELAVEPNAQQTAPNTTGAVSESFNEDPDAYRELDWLELVPDDYSFDKLFDMVQEKFPDVDFMVLSDDDDRAIQALDYLRQLTDQAPARTDMDGQRVRVPGFIVPLDPEGEAIKNFLLVPYYGACIHTPPPPANQVIVVRSPEPYEQADLFAPVWVNGSISAVRYEGDLAAAGYELEADLVEPYEYF
ncbi:DUF3299 domain-containing protein [Salinibius halmophilus]|uniref:DUF3299 domain-containing protein n=1 Tax=Salinibius halmophilus TaxID=1853216 RepID=UPI001314C7E0|nr:DUF3299 domain-containing protein [Salinibius halmophilus]